MLLAGCAGGEVEVDGHTVVRVLVDVLEEDEAIEVVLVGLVELLTELVAEVDVVV